MPEEVFQQMEIKKNSENAREFSLQDAHDSALRALINQKKVCACICMSFDLSLSSKGRCNCRTRTLT